jgi:hypothetical protein
MTEPDVTLTDYGLAVLCSWFAWNLWKHAAQSRQLQTLWIIFFGSIAAASLTGGTVHGFFLDESTLGYKLLWLGTLLAIGVTAATAWIMTGLLFSGSSKLKPWKLSAAITFILYAGVVIFYSQSFTVVILNYLPAMIALLAASARGYTQTRSNSFRLVAGGILISFIAAFIQQAGLSIHPTFFNHNSTYHLIQAFGLLVLFKGSKGLLTIERVHR